MERPIQTIPFDKKDEEWAKKNLEYYIGLSTFNSPWSDEKSKMQQCYNAYHGILNMEDYAQILKPYGEDTPKEVSSLAKIKNYPIIKPVIDLLYGEYVKRPKNFTVVVSDPDLENIRLSELNKELIAASEQMFINLNNEAGIDTGQPSAKVPPFKDIQNKYDPSTWREKRAIAGQGALNYIVQYSEVHEKFSKGFIDFLIAGYGYTLKEANGNDIEYTLLDPRDVDHDRDPNIEYIEDGEWAAVRYRTSISKIIETFYKDLSEKEIEDLQKLTADAYSSDYYNSYASDRLQDSFNNSSIEVVRLFWKSQKQLIYVNYIDEMGQVQVREEEEGYKLNVEAGDLDMEKLWVDEVWETTRIANKLYKRIRPTVVQRTSLDNPNIVKLPINGKGSAHNRNTGFFSLVNSGLVYQVMYNIYKFRLEDTVAKARGVLLKLRLDNMPDDWELEEWLYYATELGLLIEEGTAPNGDNQSVLDLTFRASITHYLELLQSVLQEWEELSGVTRQRKGQTSATETKGGIEHAIVQSSLNTEIYNSLFQSFEQREYNGLLDTSKVAWVNGKKAWFYMPDMGKIFLDIDGIQHSESNYGVFATNSTEELNKLRMYQNVAQQLASSGKDFGVIADIIESKNTAKIRLLMKKADEAAREFEMALQEQQTKTAEVQSNSNMEIEQFKQKNENYRAELKAEADIKRATIQALGMGINQSPDADADGKPDVVEIAQLALDNKKLNLEEQVGRAEIALKNKELDIKREDIASKEKIAKSKPKPNGSGK